MIRWTRAPETGRIYTCGLCGHPIARGAAIKLITLDRVAEALIRCECDGPAPPDLPAVLELTAAPPPALTPLRFLLPLDWSTTRPRGRDE